MEELVKHILNYMEFSKVVNVSITASWVILAVLVLRLLLKKAPKWIHVALWGVVAVRILFPWSIESPFSLIPSTQTIPEEIMQYEGEQLAEPAYLKVVTNPVIVDKVTVELNQSVERVQISTMYMNLIWWGGMALMLLYTTISYFRVSRKVQMAVLLRENIFQSEYIDAPFVFGIARPRIYLPYKISEKDMSYVIAHEQTHIRRRDHWWKPVGFVLLTIHWFNPLMWLAYSLFCKDIELACDECVVKALNHEQRADYSQALLSCSVNRKVIAACPLAFGEVGVAERVKKVLNYRKPAFWLLLASLLACAVLAVCFLTDPIEDVEKENVATEEEKENGDVTESTDTNREIDAVDDMVVSMQTDGFVSYGYENYYDDYDDYYTVSYKVQLGDVVKDGSIYVEQWYAGQCTKSVPGVLSEATSEIYIRMITDRGATGGEVAIGTDEYGGEWIVDFAIPEDDYMYGWRFETHGKGETLQLNPDDEKILAILAYDGGKLRDSVLEEPQKLVDEVGYAVVVRAVFGNGTADEPTGEQEHETETATDEQKGWYAESVLDLNEVVAVEDEKQKVAYIEALEQIIYYRILPDGYETSPGSKTKFVIYDIDSDGRKELLIMHENIMADTSFAIYDYDEETGALYEELKIWPSISFYDNGIVEGLASHNQGMAPGYNNTDFWPYSLYQYNERTDTYEHLLNVDAWEKAYAKTAWTGETFQEEADIDGDGMLYYIMTDGVYNYDEPIDGTEYMEWRDSILGEPMQLKFQYIELPYVFPEAEA